jgi:hypothetical protein
MVDTRCRLEIGSSHVRSMVALAFAAIPAVAQLVDNTVTPNVAGAGINKSFIQQVGSGRGTLTTPESSLFIINRDPFRSIRRGRQIFQRKFTQGQGNGPLTGDGSGDVGTDGSIAAGLTDSCAACHGRPRGAAGSGGDVVTRPDSRDAPHLFGLGLQEMIADEITANLRAIRAAAALEARATSKPVTRQLTSKTINFGSITALPNGNVDIGGVRGVNPDLRVRPFFAHGGTISIREFLVGAFNAEMGLEACDPDLDAARAGARIVTPSGMVLDGSIDKIEASAASSPNSDPDRDGTKDEIPVSIVDHLEFYLLNYFKPALYRQSPRTERGRRVLERIGCTSCHIPDLQIDRDRRVADVETVYDPANGIFNNLFATAVPLFVTSTDNASLPALKRPALQPFLVRNIFTDFRRHDLGPNFWEVNYDGTIQKQFMTEPLWGVGTTGPYGHDGRSINLTEVILRHGGDAQAAREAFAALPDAERDEVLEFLNSLVLFPPDDTASTLDRGNRLMPGFPQFGHGSIRLTVLFGNPNDPE